MTQLHDLRLQLLVQQESERIAESQPTDLDLSVVQARCLCWLAVLAEAHEDQANDAEGRRDTTQAMGWFADSMRLHDVISVVSSIEIPLPGSAEEDGDISQEGNGINVVSSIGIPSPGIADDDEDIPEETQGSSLISSHDSAARSALVVAAFLLLVAIVGKFAASWAIFSLAA